MPILAFYTSDAQTGKTILLCCDIYKKAWTSYYLLSVMPSGLAIYLPQCQDSKLQKPCLYDNRCEPKDSLIKPYCTASTICLISTEEFRSVSWPKQFRQIASLRAVSSSAVNAIYIYTDLPPLQRGLSVCGGKVTKYLRYLNKILQKICYL